MVRQAALVVAALLTAAAVPLAASAQGRATLPAVGDIPLPTVPGKATVPIPVPPAVLPVDPPPVPKVAIPALPLPARTPAPKPSATATPRPPATASRPARTPPATGSSSPAPHDRSTTRTARRPRGGHSRPAARRPTRRARASAPRPDPGPVVVAQAAPRAAHTRAAPERPRSDSGLAHDVVELVQTLPAALLWGLLGIAALALGLAGNAFWQTRQRAALEAQRAELLDDIGLLSSALLPPVPAALDGVTVSAAYRPADGPAAGGDFYDVFQLDEHRLGVLLGDVSGHGRDSLTQAALARYTLRTLLAAGHRPGEALARADRMLVRDLRPHFVTVIAAAYDTRTGELTYAKAGHAPPIVLGTAHDADAETPACPLGLGLGDDWPEFCLQLTDGASVCLYTDGLEDARREGTRLGRECVARLLAAREIPDAALLLGDLAEVADRISDDAAAVVLRRTQTARPTGELCPGRAPATVV